MSIKKIRIVHVFVEVHGGITTVVDAISKVEGNKFEILSLPLHTSLKKFEVVKSFLWLIKSYKKILKSVDIVHLHGAWSIHLWLLFKKPKQALLISPHGALHKISLQKNVLKKKIALFLYMHRVYQHADCFHALTMEEAGAIKAAGFRDKPIAVIPNGIELQSSLEISDEKTAFLLKLANNRKIYLSLSRLHVSKGLEMLIEAFDQLRKYDDNNVLFIAGSGDVTYSETLQKKIDRLGLNEVVFLLGPMYGKEKNSIYNVADVFVLPSFNEGFGLTVLEALRQKTPVITTTGTPFADLEKRGAGWYVPTEQGALFSALRASATLTKGQLAAMGENGYRWIAQEYSMDSVLDKYQQLYLWLSQNGTNKPDFIIE